MQSTVLNYRIIIEPETQEKTGKTVYNAYAPSLGVADWGKTPEEAEEHIHEAIECHVESLIKHDKPVPAPDSSHYRIATTSIELPKGMYPAFA